VLAVAVALAGLTALLQAAPPPPSLSADLDGSGASETARVIVSGDATELEIADASGRRIARAPLPLPASRADMAALSSGALGSAGALLEVSYPGTEGRTCRGVWRFREGRLARLPVRGPEGPLPDCLEPGWSYRWERPDQKAPALYVRERSLATPDGVANDVEVYVFTGFELAFTPASSHREIRGVPIPPWPDVVFYPRMALEDTLSSRFGLSRLRELPRLRILASQADRLFELRIEDPSGGTQTFPVCRATRGPAEREVHLIAEGEGRTLRVRVALGGLDPMVPVEAAVLGLGAPSDGFYVPVLRHEPDALRVYPSAEDEIAVDALSGRWSSERGDRTEIAVVSGFPAVLRVGRQEFSLSIARAPQGVDMLLVPLDGSLPTAGLTLRGPDRIARIPLSCEPSGACRIAGASEPLRREGARLNH
jgi:hypothetical protein